MKQHLEGRNIHYIFVRSEVFINTWTSYWHSIFNIFEIWMIFSSLTYSPLLLGFNNGNINSFALFITGIVFHVLLSLSFMYSTSIVGYIWCYSIEHDKQKHHHLKTYAIVNILHFMVNFLKEVVVLLIRSHKHLT